MHIHIYIHIYTYTYTHTDTHIHTYYNIYIVANLKELRVWCRGKKQKQRSKKKSHLQNAVIECYDGNKPKGIERTYNLP